MSMSHVFDVLLEKQIQKTKNPNEVNEHDLIPFFFTTQRKTMGEFHQLGSL